MKTRIKILLIIGIPVVVFLCFYLTKEEMVEIRAEKKCRVKQRSIEQGKFSERSSNYGLSTCYMEIYEQRCAKSNR